jgi:hypothetical protein
MAGSVIAALLAAAALQALVSAAVGGGPVVLAWPRRAAVRPRSRARAAITAIYLSTHKTHGRATVTIDAFAAGIPAPLQLNISSGCSKDFDAKNERLPDVGPAV